MQTFRTNIVLPRSLVKEIDKVIGRRERSNFLAEAAFEKLRRMRFEKALEKSFGSWGAQGRPRLGKEKDMEAFLRDIRSATERQIQERMHE